MLDIVLTDNAKFTLEYIFDTIEMKFGAKSVKSLWTKSKVP